MDKATTFTLEGRPSQVVNLGTCNGPTGQGWDIKGTVYDTPNEANYWLAYVTAERTDPSGKGKVLKLQVQLYKSAAPTLVLAVTMIHGDPLTSIRSLLYEAGDGPGNLTIREVPGEYRIIPASR